jgi:hypothetical protein
MAMGDYDDIRQRVEKANGIQKMPMVELRDAEGHGRLGRYVCQRISTSLRGVGLAHYPEDLPEGQHEQVLVFKANSVVAETLDALRTQDLRFLRDLNGKGVNRKLEEIRRILDEDE